MKDIQRTWQAPIAVPENDPVGAGLVRRAESFLRELLEDTVKPQPLSKLKDLERYLRSLPNQGSYFAEAVREQVEPPSFMPSVQVSIIGASGIENRADTDAQEADDIREWQQEWRGKVTPLIGPFWDLVLEALRANQKA